MATGKRSKDVPLTVDKVFKLLKKTKKESWDVGATVLDVWGMYHSSQLEELIENCKTDDQRMKIAVKFWLSHCPYASWRYLIWRLEDEGYTDVAMEIHNFAEPLSDPNLNVEILMPLLSPLSILSLGRNCLQVPLCKREEIDFGSLKNNPEAQRRALIMWYLNYSPFADFAELCGKLYFFNHIEVLKEVRKCVHREPDTTLTVRNMIEALKSTSQSKWRNFSGLPMELNLNGFKPTTTREEYIRHYVEQAPFPSWKHVAYAAYKQVEYNALEIILQRRCFKDTLQNLCVNAIVSSVKTKKDIELLPLPKKLKQGLLTHYL